MNWTIESAKQHFTEIINQAIQEAQAIFNDKQIVAAVIDAQTFNLMHLNNGNEHKKVLRLKPLKN